MFKSLKINYYSDYTLEMISCIDLPLAIMAGYFNPNCHQPL